VCITVLESVLVYYPPRERERERDPPREREREREKGKEREREGQLRVLLTSRVY